MAKGMRRVHSFAARRIFGRVARFGLLGSLRSIEIKPEAFRRELAAKHGIYIVNFDELLSVPVERLDAVAAVMIRDAERLALLEGAGFGLGGAITLLPDISVLTFLSLRLIQRLCLLYGLEPLGHPAAGPDRDARVHLWLTVAAAAGVDYGKEIAGKEVAEKLVPRLIARLAVKLGEESAEKWVCRLLPLASSAIGGALNYGFVRAWGRRVQHHLRERRLAAAGMAQ